METGALKVPALMNHLAQDSNPLNQNTVEAPVSGHPREAEKMSATGAGHVQECVNTKYV